MHQHYLKLLEILSGAILFEIGKFYIYFSTADIISGY